MLAHVKTHTHMLTFTHTHISKGQGSEIWGYRKRGLVALVRGRTFVFM